MKKTSLLSLTLLLCPMIVISGEKQPNEFPSLSDTQKKPSSSRKNKKVTPIQKSNAKVTDTIKIKENTINDTSSDLEIPFIDTVNDMLQDNQIIENNDNKNKCFDTYFTESSSPVEQEKRGFFGKLWSMGKSYRDLSLYWLNQNEIPQKSREQAQNDIKWAITEENKTIKYNRNNNENFINNLKNCEKFTDFRHKLILTMLGYLKENEINTQFLDKFVHANEKGLPFDNSQILDDTYKILQSEDKHDFFALALMTLEVMNRVQERQKTRNHIYAQTKDNKKVVGHFSDKDYSNPQVVYDKTQHLMKELITIKNNQEQEEKLKRELEEKAKEELKNKKNDKK